MTPPSVLVIGHCLGDMHYGLPDLTKVGLVLTNRITIDTPGGTQLIESAWASRGVRKNYTNKMLVVIDSDERRASSGWIRTYTLAYSYDNRRIGFFEVETSPYEYEDEE